LRLIPTGGSPGKVTSLVCSSYGTAGGLLKSGIANIDLILEGYGSSITICYHTLEPYIKEKRKEAGPNYWMNFDWLCQKTIERYRSLNAENSIHNARKAISTALLDPQKARFLRTVRLFCADCDHDFGPARHETLGLHFICPNEPQEGPPHLARAILDEPPAKTWLRWEKKLFNFQRTFSPFMVLRKLKRDMEAGTYICISMAFLLVAIVLWHFLSMLPATLRCLLGLFILGLVLWRFIDIFLTNISITFTSRFPANPIRSVLYSLMGYIQIALSFAFFYIAMENEHFTKDVTPVASVFFSFGTIATVGYGDLSPTTLLARLLVVLELILGLFFVAIILAQVAGWATKSRREEGDYPIQDLR
jgi:hypothetical protein